MAAKCLACAKQLPKRGRARCPPCGHVFRGSGWDGIEAHWKAKHQDVMPYKRFWGSLCAKHRTAAPITCLCCEKGIPPRLPRQCPECALVLQGPGWSGIRSHWQARHEDLIAYDAFWNALCPGHRSDGDGGSGFLPFHRRRSRS